MSRVLVTGSAGHLGEALMRTLRDEGTPAVGVDRRPSAFTDVVGSILDRPLIERAMEGCDAVLHTATLHKPHVATHSMQSFVDTNITGTLVLLESAIAAGVSAFVFTSTTSTFGHALRPAEDQPAIWVTESLRPEPKNIYGATKTAAEDLCALFHQRHGLPCVVLRTSRFFPEEDDSEATRRDYAGDNAKTNEFLYRRVAIEDVVTAHQRAIGRASALGFGRYIISATTPFTPDDLAQLMVDAPAVVERRVPGTEQTLAGLGWTMFPRIDRVYVNEAARRELQWRPRFDFARVLDRVCSGHGPLGSLAEAVGIKGYHAQTFDGDAPYPT